MRFSGCISQYIPQFQNCAVRSAHPHLRRPSHTPSPHPLHRTLLVHVTHSTSLHLHHHSTEHTTPTVPLRRNTLLLLSLHPPCRFTGARGRASAAFGEVVFCAVKWIASVVRVTTHTARRSSCHHSPSPPRALLSSVCGAVRWCAALCGAAMWRHLQPTLCRHPPVGVSVGSGRVKVPALFNPFRPPHTTPLSAMPSRSAASASAGGDILACAVSLCRWVLCFLPIFVFPRHPTPLLCSASPGASAWPCPPLRFF